MKKCILFCAILCLILCGCSSNTPSKVVEDRIKQLKTDMINDNFDIFDFDDTSSSDDSSNIEISNELAKELKSSMAKYDYKINNETIDGDFATVNVTFTSYDFGVFLANFFADILQKALGFALTNPGNDEMNTIYNDILKERLKEAIDKGKTREITVDFVVNKVDGKWIFDEESNRESFADAATGGFYSAIIDIQKSFENFGQ